MVAATLLATLLAGAPTGTAVGVACPGDCDADGATRIAELVAAVAGAIDGDAERCPAADTDGSGAIAVGELVASVAAALGAPCPEVREPAVLWGVDANYVRLFEEQGRQWRVGGVPVDPLAELARAGARVFRLRVWVENDPGNLEPGTLERHARLLARRAQHLGMYVVPVFFMSRGWGADTEQDAPAAWAGLPVAERAEAARLWAAAAARRLRLDGIRTRLYGIGNETDHGFCGVFEATADVARLRQAVWPDAARLMRATAQGIQEGSARGDLRFVVHIARGWDPAFAVAYFAAMLDHGVPVELAGLSWYPNSWGRERSSRFDASVARLHGELGLRTWIPEYAYAAATGFPGWEAALDGYPLDENGQARFVADLRERVFADPRLAGAIYWSPEEAHALFPWSVMGLFRPAPDGRSPAPRPALHALGPPGGDPPPSGQQLRAAAPPPTTQ